jgi:hypothetical protein
MARHRRDADAACAGHQFHRHQQVSARVLARGGGDAARDAEHALPGEGDENVALQVEHSSGPVGRFDAAA